LLIVPKKRNGRIPFHCWTLKKGTVLLPLSQCMPLSRQLPIISITGVQDDFINDPIDKGKFDRKAG
jgi:hypothetical protein